MLDIDRNKDLFYSIISVTTDMKSTVAIDFFPYCLVGCKMTECEKNM